MYENANVRLNAALDPDAPMVDRDFHRITIRRDPMTATPTDIQAHELPIVQELYGDENITVVSSFAMSVPENTVDEEYDRLLAKYALSRTKVVQAVYPTRRDLADAMGVRYSRKAGAQRASSQLPGSAVVENFDPRIKSTSEGDAAAAKASAAAVEVRAKTGLASKADVKEASAAVTEAAKAEKAEARMEAGPVARMARTSVTAKPTARKATKSTAKKTAKKTS